jgi:chromosome segregation ATPase
MNTQRFKIQLQNYNTKKDKLELQIKNINTELENINSNIEKENQERIYNWRELYKKCKIQGLPVPKPIINYQEEINNCQSKLELLNHKINQHNQNIELLRNKIINYHYNNQEIINNEIIIHKEEKDRINNKLIDINNEFVNNTIDILNIKTDNNSALLHHTNNIYQIEEKLISCKKTEKQNRFIILDTIRKGNNLRKQFKDNIQQLQSQIDILQLQYSNLQKEQTEYLTNYNHLFNLYQTNPLEYIDLTNQIENLKYENEIITRKLMRINDTILNIKEEQCQLKTQFEIDKQKIPNSQDIMIPIETPYIDLIKQKNTNSSIIEYYNIQLKELDNKLEIEKQKYEKALENLVLEDKLCNERIQIIISQYTENFSQENKNTNTNIQLLDKEIQNYKREYFIISKELENWNIALKTDCKYQYRKKQLLDSLNSFKKELEQVSSDIKTLNRASGLI